MAIALLCNPWSLIDWILIQVKIFFLLPRTTMIYFLFPKRVIMALVKNKLSPVDQFLNTRISVLYVRISKLITDIYGYSVENEWNRI